MALITQAEWARRQGFSKQYVGKLISQGKIRLINGMVDEDAANSVLAKQRDSHLPLRRHKNSSYTNSEGVHDLLMKMKLKNEIVNENFESEDGVSRKINMLAIDSGFSTQEVYAWVRTQSIHNIMAIKGIDSSLVPLNAPTKVDVNIRGRKITNGVRLWKIGVSILKSELYGWLKQTRSEDGSIPHGYLHFPEYNTEYFKQLTAEQLVTKIVKGYPKREWQKTRDRNEALDCRIYARAAAIALGIDRWTDQKWEQISGAKEKIENQNLPAKKSRPKIIKSRWIV